LSARISVFFASEGAQLRRRSHSRLTNCSRPEVSENWMATGMLSTTVFGVSYGESLRVNPAQRSVRPADPEVRIKRLSVLLGKVTCHTLPVLGEYGFEERARIRV